jgi:hypothetical protein
LKKEREIRNERVERERVERGRGAIIVTVKDERER